MDKQIGYQEALGFQQLSDEAKKRIVNFSQGMNSSDRILNNWNDANLAYQGVLEIIHREMKIDLSGAFIISYMIPLLKKISIEISHKEG